MIVGTRYARISLLSLILSDRPESLYKAEDFSTFQGSGNVLLDVCTADSLAQLMLDRAAKKVSVSRDHTYCNLYESICFNKCFKMYRNNPFINYTLTNNLYPV